MDKQEILGRLNIRNFYSSHLPSLKANGSGMGQALCPFHNDTKPSFSVDLKSGGFRCFGCDAKGSVFDFVMKKSGLDFPSAKAFLTKEAGLTQESKRIIAKTYDYADESGDLLFQVVRYEPKSFSQRRPNGKGGWLYNLQGVRLVPYNLQEVLKSDSVTIVEGEKDAETLRGIGLVATCNPMGAGKWRTDYNQYFQEKKVVIIPDNDEPGWNHALRIAKNLKGIAESIKIVELHGLPEKGDVSDWIKSGGTKENLLRLIDDAPEWIPTNDNEKDTSPKLRAVSIEELLEVSFPPREDILSPWLQTQGLVMVHAWRGVGKTHFSLGVAYAVCSGSSFLKWQAPKAKGVLYIDGEMPGFVLKDRFSRLILSTPNDPIEPLKIITPDLQKYGIPDLATQQGQTLLEDHLDGISLVILDNLSSLCRTGKENEGESWLPMQEWALRLRTRSISVLFVHHDGKGLTQRGNTRKEDVLDAVIALKRPGDYSPEEGARFEIHFEKSRGIYGDDVKPFEARLITNQEGIQTWSIKDLEDSLTEKVANYLNDGIPQHELAELLGVAKGTVSKHKNKAKLLGLLRENG